jgi:hypothetical protein
VSPTPLGLLPSNLPLPNQRVQVKRGAPNGIDYTVSNQVAAGTILNDGAGGPMSVSYQPRYACYWLVRTNSIWRGRSDSDAAWRRCDHGIRITPADALGVTVGYKRPAPLYPSSVVQWRTHACSFLFKLNPGITYTASMTFEYSSGYWQEYHSAANFHRIIGVVLGEGEV